MEKFTKEYAEKLLVRKEHLTGIKNIDSVIEIAQENQVIGYTKALEETNVKELYEALEEAKNQIEYLHYKFKPTGSGNSVLVRIDNALKQTNPCKLKYAKPDKPTETNLLTRY